MSYYAFTGLLNFLTAGAISIFLLSFHRNNPPAKIFALFSLSVTQWSLFYWLWLISSSAKQADFFMRTCMIGVLFMPSIFFHFINVFIQHRIRNIFNYYNYLFSCLCALLVYTPIYAKTGSGFREIHYWLLPGPLFHLALIHFVVLIVFSLFLLARELFRSKGIRKNQLLYIFIGTSIGYLAGSTNFFYWYRIPIPPVLNILVSFYVIFVTYAIVKYRLMDIEIFLKRSLGGFVFITLSFLIGVPLIYLIDHFVFNVHVKAVTLVFLFGIIIPMFLRLKLRSELSLEQLFFKERFNYRQTLNEIGKAVGSKVQMNDLLGFIRDNLTSSMDLKNSSILLKDDNHYVPVLTHGFQEGEISLLNIDLENPLVNQLHEQRTILIKEELKQKAHNNYQELIKIMDQIKSEVTIPVFSKNDLIAICNIGKSGFEYSYSSEDVLALETFSSQLSVALDNARAYKEIADLNATLEQKVKERSEQLIQTQKLASLGRLVAGIAHHINNKINPPIQGAAILKKSLRRLKDNPAAAEETLSDMEVAVEAIDEELKKVKTIVDDLLISSRQISTQYQFSPLDLNAALQSVVRVIRTECLDRVRIHEAYAEALPKIKGDLARLDDVFMNILKNALDAIPEKGNIWIKTWKENRYVCTSIRDDGIGIAEENLNKIFDFFFTTKEVGRGTGLGLSVSYATVKDHGGEIRVSSKPGEGTQFMIELPMV